MKPIKKLILNNQQMLTQIIGGLGMNIINQAVLLFITILLTRYMDVEAYGLYAMLISFMIILAIPFSAGMPIFMIRHLAKYRAQEENALYKGVLRASLYWIIGGSIGVSIIFYFLAPLIFPHNFITYRMALLLLILPPILLGLGTILRAKQKVLLGRVSEFIVQPLLFVMAIGLFVWGGQSIDLGTIDVIIMQALSYGGGILICLFLLWRTRTKLPLNLVPHYQWKNWLKSAAPLIFSVGLIVINNNIDILMVGYISDHEQAGYYRVASRLSGFILFFLLAANNALAPMITHDHAQQKYQQVQYKITLIARLIFVGSLPIVLALCLLPEAILSFLFGDAFILSASALIILSLANGFSMLMGQAGQIVSLVGQEKYSAYAALIAVILNLAFNAILIPLYGLNGAACATAISIISWNGLLAYWAVSKAGYHSTIFGKWKK